MKTFKLLTAVALFLMLSVAAYCVNINAYSGNRLRAGLAVSGSVSWSSSSNSFFSGDSGNFWFPGYDVTDNGPVPWTLNPQMVTWQSAGRWFVTANTDKPYETLISKSASKSMNKNNGHNLTQMFTNSYWYYVENDDIYFSGDYGAGPELASGLCDPAGKFCLFRVRVYDAAQGERFYWVGDDTTGSFTMARQWNRENFINTPGKGRYGEYCEAVWTIPTENIDIHFNVTCIYDQARFEMNIVNNSAEAKNVSLAMYGTPATSDNPAGQWGHRQYWKYHAFYKDDGSLGGWNVVFPEALYEYDPCYFYLPGIGTIKKGTILKDKAIPDYLEMYSYRFNLSHNESATETRVDKPELNDENFNSAYALPPRSSWIDAKMTQTDQSGEYTRKVATETAFHSCAQATFDNNADATKPDYLIIDLSSNMLDTGKNNILGHYPFGFWEANYQADDGNFPTNTLWPGSEAGVATPYENSLEYSDLYVYVDQFTDPLSYMSIWGSYSIQPGRSEKVITYYGMGGKSFSNGKLNRKNNVFKRYNHSLFVESPETLGYQVTKDEFGKDKITPDEFGIKVNITNEGCENNYYDFRVNKVKITFPDGLDLADDYDNDGSYFVKSSDPEDEDTNTYFVNKSTRVNMMGVYDNILIKVKADGEYSGALEYTVKIYGRDVSGGDEWEQEVSRTILVPTTKTGYVYGGPGNLVACPFKNVTVDGQEGNNPFTVTDVYGSDTAGFLWNSEKQDYEPFGDLNSLRLESQGYWILKGVDEDSDNKFAYTFPKYLKPNDINYGDMGDSKYYMADKTLTLNKGWNIISNPYVYPMLWSTVVVKNKITGDIMSVDRAVDAGWIYKTIFTWEPTKGDDGSMIPELSKYVTHNTVDTALISNKGYWVYATKPLFIYFKPMMFPDSKIFDDDYYNDPDKFFKMGNASDEDYNITEE